MRRRPSCSLRCSPALLVCLLLGEVAAAGAPLVPTEQASRESLDGRVPAASLRNELLLLPRLVLSLPRVVVRAIAWPVRRGLMLNERYQIYDRVLRALTSADGLVGVRPAFDFMLDYRPVVGLSFFDERILGPRTALHASAEVGSDRLIVANALLRPLPGDRAATVELEGAYTLRDDQVFRAISSLTALGPDRGNSRYTLAAFDFSVRPRLALTRHLALVFLSQLGSRRFADGRAAGDLPISQVYCVRVLGRCQPGTVDERQVPGFNQGTDFVRAGMSLHVDTFDRPTHPSTGGQLDVGAHYTYGITDGSSYVHAVAALGVAVNLWQRSHVLFLRARADWIEPMNDTPVPFTELAILGGPDSLRGFRAGRFRDDSTLIFSAEYRWAIWMWADAMLFADYGGATGRNFGGLGADTLRPDVGAGIRIRTSQHVMARVQLAYGFPDGIQLNLTLGEGP